MTGMVFWNDERVQELVRVLRANPEATRVEIAAILSELWDMKVTKNSVIGIMHRIRESGLPETWAMPEKTNRGRKRTTAPKPRPKPKKPNVAPAKPKIERPVLTARQCRIDDLTARSCRWIEGDPRDAIYCGEVTEDVGSSWCAAHAKLVFSADALAKMRSAAARKRMAAK